MFTDMRWKLIPLFDLILVTTLLVLFVSPVCCNLVTDKVEIECGDDPETSKVNVTYFGEAVYAYPVKDQQIVESCEGEYRPDGSYVLEDVNHRNCTFDQVGKTKAWTIKVKVQRRNLILTALDKEFSFTCVYDDFKLASTP